MTAEERKRYLDAKWVCDNPNKFDHRDVALAREFVDGFKAGIAIAEKAVGEEREACARIAEMFEPDEKIDIPYASTEIRKRSRIKTETGGEG